MAVGQRGAWDTAVIPLGVDAGIYKKHGIDIQVLWTQGAGESQQVLLSRSVDIALAGTLGAFAIYAKGAPIRIIAAEATGAADFWYVRADSPVKSIKDFAGRTVAFSTNGASTHMMALGLIKQAGVTARPVATGGPPATLTQVMSGQIDVGWSAPPFGLKQLNDKEIRIIAHGTELEAIREQSVRVWITLADRLQQRRPVFQRLVKAYRETVDWMYASEDALKGYAALNNIPLTMARQVRDQFFPKSLLQPEKVMGIEPQITDAITHKYIAQPLTEKQLGELIQLMAGN